MITLIIAILLISQSLSSTDLYVGYPSKKNNFNTIQEAINNASSINPQDESQRVKIHISPGIYRQQIKIDTPYITLLNEEPEKDVIITWYYGIGYKYFSVGTDGLYNENSAKEKKEKRAAGGRWGATVHLFSKGKYFRAENIIFENSFNRYITEEELEDGVEVSMETDIRTIRNKSLDANSREATERAAAFSVEGAFCEFLNCQFLSSQDTLYTGSSPQYYKNCLIEGQTDYIFGGSNAVFDNCNLSWKGYSTKSLGGYITANLAGDEPYTGYVFYNCKVIASKKFEVKPGTFGRPWRETAKVTFINTILENENMISEDGWGEMGGVKPEDVEGFFEYGTKFANGTEVNLSRRKGHVIQNLDLAKLDLKSYLNNWTPYYFTSKSFEDFYEWGTLKIGGGGFISGMVSGQKEIYIRTDVGGAYKYNYEKKEWTQLFDFINEEKKEYLSIEGIAIDPTNDNIVYFLCGCAYYYPYKTAIYKTKDGGKTFQEIDITDNIEVHGNGVGRECSEPIAIDPDNPNVIYVGGDATGGESALIKSVDGGLTWNPVKGYDDLGLFKYELKWPSWTDHIVRGTEDSPYHAQSGITWVKIIDGKIYVGTSVVGEPNIHVADISNDEFSVLSHDLPTENYPLTIKYDENGNVYLGYIKHVYFDGGAGGLFKYNLFTKKVTDISPINKAIGLTIDKKDPNKIIARTSSIWMEQWWSETRNYSTIAWGDQFYRSVDGGASWINITPGQKSNNDFISRPLKENGYSWIINKSIHWGPGIVIDPRNSDRILMASGNGIFVCDNIWDEKDIQFYFDPKGIEEVVSTDMVSVKGGKIYSTILDFDGFMHKNIEDIGIQYLPNMGSTSAIAVCRQNPNILFRISNDNDLGYYSENAGETWIKMDTIGGIQAGRAAITVNEKEEYRFFHVLSDKIMFSDNYGKTWEESTGLVGEEFNLLVEESNPLILYSYSHVKDSNSEYNGKNILSISKDGGKSFTPKIVGDYDGSDFSKRIAYISKGKIALSAGNKGLYISSNFGENIIKLENVEYCKTVGFGAPEKDGQDNVLYMYGRPYKFDPNGLYRSQDEGKTWVLLNYKKLYGGTGNGNYVVGDMNTFGTFYMSSLGTGIIYGKVK